MALAWHYYTASRIIMYMRYVTLGVVLLACAGFVWWFAIGVNAAAQSIEVSQARLAEPAAVPVAIVRFDGVKRGLVVPSWRWLDENQLWAYVAADSSISSSWRPELTKLPVMHGSWLAGERIHPRAQDGLRQLFAAAEDAGFSLIVISAYRSVEEQHALYAGTTNEQGPAYAAQYIALPDQSEHQLGLAVDLASATPECVQASVCSLDPVAAAWLETNAPTYGFILRYPAGKADITGIAHEPWHFRYVGGSMAAFVRESGLTYDEIMRKLRLERP